MDVKPWKLGNRWVGIDLERRRLWIGGQRVHHGVTGLMVAAAGLTGLAARRFTTRGGLEWTLLGSALIAHDWSDRSVWFKRGPGE
ncbi:MAG TPA: hypothetical protein VEK39_01540 [Solirubrobacterales bacterium]|nr:hypothetical protein [Solirubrobacterales bacterium]